MHEQLNLFEWALKKLSLQEQGFLRKMFGGSQFVLPGFILSVLLFSVIPAWAGVPIAYVVNRNSDDVSVINTLTDTVIHTEAVGVNPSGIAVNPDGTEVYVSCLDTPEVFIIDTFMHTVIDTVSLPVGSRSQEVHFTPDGAKAFVVIQDSNAVGVIDTTNRTVTKIITGFNSPTGIDILRDGTKAYVTNFGVNHSGTTVSVIDIGTETIDDTVTVGQGPNGVTSTLDSAKVYVANPFSNSVSVIETTNNTVINTLPANSPNYVVVSPDGTKAYVSSNPAIAIDTNTDSIMNVNHPAGGGRFAFTPDGNKMYHTGGSSEVSVIDVVNDTLITTVTVGDNPQNVAITPALIEIPFIHPIEPWVQNGGFGFGDDWVVKKCRTEKARKRNTCDPFGPRRFKHVGFDAQAPVETPVMASADGVVAFAPDKIKGNVGGAVVLEHDLDGNPGTTNDMVTTLYLHVDPLVNVGAIVEQGDVIAMIADIKGAHLHFGFREAPFPSDRNASIRGALPPPGTSGCQPCFGSHVEGGLQAFPENWVDPQTIF